MDDKIIQWDREPEECEVKEYSNFYDIGDISSIAEGKCENELYVLVHENVEDALNDNTNKSTGSDYVYFKTRLTESSSLTAFYANEDCAQLYISKGDCIIVQLVDDFVNDGGVYVVKTENKIHYTRIVNESNMEIIGRVLEIRRRFF